MLLTRKLTSQVTALLQVVYALAVVALAQLLPHQPRHHALHPLLANDRVLRGFQRFVVIVVDAVERRRHRRLGRFEHLGLRGGHGVRTVRGCFGRRVYGGLVVGDWSVAVWFGGVVGAVEGRPFVVVLVVRFDFAQCACCALPARLRPASRLVSAKAQLRQSPASASSRAVWRRLLGFGRLGRLLPLQTKRFTPSRLAPGLFLLLLLTRFSLLSLAAPKILPVCWHSVRNLPSPLVELDRLRRFDAAHESFALVVAGRAEGSDFPALVGVGCQLACG